MYNICFKQNINLIAEKIDKIMDNGFDYCPFTVTRCIINDVDLLPQYQAQKEVLTFLTHSKGYRQLPHFFASKNCSQIDFEVSGKSVDTLFFYETAFQMARSLNRNNLYGISKYIALEGIRKEHLNAKILHDTTARSKKYTSSEPFVYNTALMENDDYPLEEAWAEYDATYEYEDIVYDENEKYEEFENLIYAKVQKKEIQACIGFRIVSLQPPKETVRLEVFYGRENAKTPFGQSTIFERKLDLFFAHPKKFASELESVWAKALDDPLQYLN